MKRILCIWLPNWPIQRFVVGRPELKSSAIALYAQQPRRGERVMACSRAAIDYGIRLDMPLAEASSIAGQASSLSGQAGGTVFLARHDPGADLEVLNNLAEHCEQFSPVVGLENAEQPQCLLLDVTGTASLFGDEHKLAKAVRKDFEQRGYVAQIAVADTIGAAWGLARFGTFEDQNSRFETVIPSGETRAAIKSLSVNALRLAEPTIKLLGQLGITHIEQLLELPRTSLPSRLGNQLLLRLDQMTGAVAEMIVPQRSTTDFAAAWSLEHPTAHRGTIEQIVSELIRQVATRLADCDQGAVELDCQLDCIDSQPARIHVGFYQPTASSQHLLALVQMQLELLALQGAVHQVQVSATTTAALESQQHALFEDPSHTHPRQLGLLVDRLSSRLGREQIVQPRLQPGSLPERAYEYRVLTGANKRGSEPFVRSNLRDVPAKGSGPLLSALSRPLQLLFPPLPLDVVSVAHDGPPVVFHYQQQQHKVARSWGPERIETAWWRGPSIRRDYYRTETANGTRFWLFRRLQDGKWFLHGTFG